MGGWSAAIPEVSDPSETVLVHVDVGRLFHPDREVDDRFGGQARNGCRSDVLDDPCVVDDIADLVGCRPELLGPLRVVLSKHVRSSHGARSGESQPFSADNAHYVN